MNISKSAEEQIGQAHTKKLGNLYTTYILKHHQWIFDLIFLLIGGIINLCNLMKTMKVPCRKFISRLFLLI